MKQFFASYGLAIVMLIVCLGSHLFMHRKGGHTEHKGHCGASHNDNHDQNKTQQ